VVGQPELAEAALIGAHSLVRQLTVGRAADPRGIRAHSWATADLHVLLVRELLYPPITRRIRQHREPARAIDEIHDMVMTAQGRIPGSTRQLLIHFLGQPTRSWPYPVVRDLVGTVVAGSSSLGIGMERIDYSPLLVTALVFPQLSTDVPRLMVMLTRAQGFLSTGISAPVALASFLDDQIPPDKVDVLRRFFRREHGLASSRSRRKMLLELLSDAEPADRPPSASAGPSETWADDDPPLSD
jgi:hypothetical protein